MKPTAQLTLGLGLAAALLMAAPGFGGMRQQTSGRGEVRAAHEVVVLVVNKDQFEGKWKQFKGDLKKKWGKFTDDDLMQIEGNYDKFEGKMQERYGDKKEEVKRWSDEWFERHGKN